MIKILLIEDEFEKKRLLTEALLSVTGIALHNIDFASDVRSAKQAIKLRKYDLVILDINLPPTPDQVSQVGAGLAVLSFIKRNRNANPPSFIVGMTAHDDGAVAAEEEFSSPLWKLVRFSYRDNLWKNPLCAAVQYLIEKNTPPYSSDGATFHTDLAIFVALEDEELSSIKNLDANWVERKIPHDHTRYFEGYFQNSYGKISVVVAAAPKMGLPTAATISTKLIAAYRPRIVAIAGICAGVREKVDLGDILIADPCFDWGSGKWLRTKEGEIRFRPAPYPWRLDEKIRTAAKLLTERPNFLESLHANFSGPKPEKQPTVYIEAMASGGSVLQVGQLMDDVREQHKNLVGVEMESYAIFTAAEYSAEPRPLCFSVKAVCDFGDEDKGDAVHHYAAYASARFVQELALSLLVNDEDADL